MILVTGFEPFGGSPWNPSEEIARALNGREVSGVAVRGAVLPCVFGESVSELLRLVGESRPQLVICLGVAGSRSCLSLERVAINVDDARIPDNAGRSPIDEAVVAGGPVGYWSTLPIKAIRAAWEAAGYPCEISQTAGTFVCNHVFYGLMHHFSGRAGFIHVPGSGLTLPAMVSALELAIEVCLSTKEDVRLNGGAES